MTWGSDWFLTRATAGHFSSVVDLYDRATGLWSTARLSLDRCCLSATSVGTVAIFAGGVSSVVDLYDSGTRQWSTAQLSQARSYLSATSVGTVAFFAGGELLMIVFVCCARACLLRFKYVL